MAEFDEVIRHAVDELARGLVVVVPTDTVYGLAALPDRPNAIKQIFSLKGRTDAKPLPVLGANVESLSEVVLLDERSRLLAERYWPGPLTIVLPRATGFAHDLGGHLEENVAVRVPKSETTLRLLRIAGPLAVTSANLSGGQPALTIDDARSVFSTAVTVYIDGGPGAGESSTVISLVDELRVLRTGPIPEGQIRQTLTP